LHGAVGQWLGHAADAAQVSVIVCIFIVRDLQGMINKRPDSCNKSFMLIDTAYSNLSPSK
jgi:hypothetical protein